MALPSLSHRGGSAADPPRPRTAGPPPLLLRLTAVLAVPVLLYMLYATGLKALDNYRLNLDAASLRQEIRDLRAQNIRLQDDIVQARTDAAIEVAAREQLGLAMPGDKAIFLLGSGDNQARTASPSPPDQPAEPPPLEQWWRHFFGPPIRSS